LARERGYQTVAIGSTDLTHYGPNYGFSPMGTGTPALDWVTKKNDPAFIEKVLAMDPEGMLDEGLAHYNACCSGAAATAVAAGKKLGATRGQLIAYDTSHAKSPGQSFVGYAGVVF
ncbi:MAG: AmmeMemoRadiSam system protein B, partial [Thermodesulfobacteriota bacterium]